MEEERRERLGGVEGRGEGFSAQRSSCVVVRTALLEESYSNRKLCSCHGLLLLAEKGKRGLSSYPLSTVVQPTAECTCFLKKERHLHEWAEQGRPRTS